MRAIWGRPFVLALFALLVALGVVALASITGAAREAETVRLREKVDSQDAQIRVLSQKADENQEANACRSRAAAAADEADGEANDALRQSLIDRVVGGVPIPERTGQMLLLNAKAKAAREKRTQATVECSKNTNFIPK